MHKQKKLPLMIAGVGLLIGLSLAYLAYFIGSQIEPDRRQGTTTVSVDEGIEWFVERTGLTVSRVQPYQNQVFLLTTEAPADADEETPVTYVLHQHGDSWTQYPVLAYQGEDQTSEEEINAAETNY